MMVARHPRSARPLRFCSSTRVKRVQSAHAHLRAQLAIHNYSHPCSPRHCHTTETRSLAGAASKPSHVRWGASPAARTYGVHHWENSSPACGTKKHAAPFGERAGGRSKVSEWTMGGAGRAAVRQAGKDLDVQIHGSRGQQYGRVAFVRSRLGTWTGSEGKGFWGLCFPMNELGRRKVGSAPDG